MAAKTAKEQGHDVVLWLWNEAVTLGRKGVADHVTGVNLTPLKELLAHLNPDKFWQIHRSTIVNSDHVAAAVRVDPQIRYLRRAASCALAAGQPKSAVEYAKKAHGLAPGDPSSARPCLSNFRPRPAVPRGGTLSYGVLPVRHEEAGGAGRR